MDLNTYIRPEFMILPVVCYVIGLILKSSERVKDKYIPAILGAVSVFCATLYIFGVTPVASFRDALNCLFTGITQGVLCAGASVYFHQLIKQSGKDE